MREKRLSSSVSGTWRPTRTPPAPGKKPSSGSWLHSSAHYRLSPVRKARSSAAKSAVCKTPNCRRIKSFEMVVTARLRKEGCSNPASRQNARPDSPGRNVPRSELTATTIRSSDPYGGGLPRPAGLWRLIGPRTERAAALPRHDYSLSYSASRALSQTLAKAGSERRKHHRLRSSSENVSPSSATITLSFVWAVNLTVSSSTICFPSKCASTVFMPLTLPLPPHALKHSSLTFVGLERQFAVSRTQERVAPGVSTASAAPGWQGRHAFGVSHCQTGEIWRIQKCQ